MIKRGIVLNDLPTHLLTYSPSSISPSLSKTSHYHKSLKITPALSLSNSSHTQTPLLLKNHHQPRSSTSFIKLEVLISPQSSTLTSILQHPKTHLQSQSLLNSNTKPNSHISSHSSPITPQRGPFDPSSPRRTWRPTRPTSLTPGLQTPCSVDLCGFWLV